MDGKWSVCGKITPQDITLNLNVAGQISLGVDNGAPIRNIPVVKTVNTITNSSFMKVRHDVFDSRQLTCDVGLLCWVHVNINNITATSRRRPTCCVGFNVDLLIHLQKSLGIQFEIYQVRDMKYGAEINGSWNGLIRDLIKRKADMASALMAISETRARVVEFSSMIFLGKVKIATVTNETLLPYINSETFEPLTYESWFIVLGLTVIGIFFMYVLEKLVPSQTASYSLIESVVYMVGLLFQRDVGGEIPRHLASRTVSVTMAISMMVLMTAYTAVLTARNIRFGRDLPITGYNDQKVSTITNFFSFY